jgi:hypothetical protein
MEWFEPESLVVEVSQVIVHETNESDAIVGLFDSDGLSSEDLTEIDLAHFEADAAARPRNSCIDICTEDFAVHLRDAFSAEPQLVFD